MEPLKWSKMGHLKFPGQCKWIIWSVFAPLRSNFGSQMIFKLVKRHTLLHFDSLQTQQGFSVQFPIDCGLGLRAVLVWVNFYHLGSNLNLVFQVYVNQIGHSKEQNLAKFVSNHEIFNLLKLLSIHVFKLFIGGFGPIAFCWFWRHSPIMDINYLLALLFGFDWNTKTVAFLYWKVFKLLWDRVFWYLWILIIVHMNQFIWIFQGRVVSRIRIFWLVLLLLLRIWLIDQGNENFTILDNLSLF